VLVLATLPKQAHCPFNLRARFVLRLGVLREEVADLLRIQLRSVIADVLGYRILGHLHSLLTDGNGLDSRGAV
jgi:hypothetical protein